jgi:hypothetical protein
MKQGARPTDAHERAFLHSVLYASVFDYPLTPEQLHESLLHVPASPSDIIAWYARSGTLQAAVDCRNGYYFPHGRSDLVDIRHAREASSRRVLHDLQRPLSLVVRMPFVRMVALSGSLAHLNADRGADLDLFVITARGKVWSVTTTVIACARLFGWRRRLCLNYVISEDQLAVKPRDLFSANQIIHLRPVSGAAMYGRFLDANPFVARFYPNFRPRSVPLPEQQHRMTAAVEWLLERTVAPLYERCCRRAYRWYLRRRAGTWQSRDQVRLAPECLKLHTTSHRQRVMAQFQAAVEDAERANPSAHVGSVSIRSNSPPLVRVSRASSALLDSSHK